MGDTSKGARTLGTLAKPREAFRKSDYVYIHTMFHYVYIKGYIYIERDIS